MLVNLIAILLSSEQLILRTEVDNQNYIFSIFSELRVSPHHCVQNFSFFFQIEKFITDIKKLISCFVSLGIFFHDVSTKFCKIIAAKIQQKSVIFYGCRKSLAKPDKIYKPIKKHLISDQQNFQEKSTKFLQTYDFSWKKI